MLIILHAPIEEPDVADREEVREDGGSNVEREGSKHEGCSQDREDDGARTEEVTNSQGEAEQALYCIPCLLSPKSALNSKDGRKSEHIKWHNMYKELPEHEPGINSAI